MSKRLALPAIVVIIGLIFALSQVSVQAYGPNHDDLVGKFAEAFGKSEAEVQAVFDEIHEQHQQEMQSAFNTQLDEAVARGQITVEQKQLIIDKHAEMRLTHEEMRDEKQEMTREEWRATRQALHDELETWFEENGIDESMFFMMGKGPRGEGRGMRGDFEYDSDKLR